MKRHYWMLTLFALMLALPTFAQDGGLKPFIMPAEGPPTLDTWLFGQAYGNTTGAYNFGENWYRAGQGLHFGLDLSMPCGTPLVAVADGVVAFVDDMAFGSAPHNLILKHEALGMTTLYGHLLQAPALMQGQLVRQGDVIALSGDPDSTCDSRPHLHFEVRSLDYSRTINPVSVIEAEWHSLALIGPYGFPLFQQDLTHPARWVTLDDQPDVYFWGPVLNQYPQAAPLTYDRRPAPSPQPARITPASDANSYVARRVTDAGCCAYPFWDAADPARFYAYDGPDGQIAGAFAWDVAAPDAAPVRMRPAPMPYQSPTGRYEIEPFVNGFTKVRDVDGEVSIDTGGRVPTMNPAESALLWVQSDGVTVPGQSRPDSRVIISQPDGQSIREIFAAPGADARWLDDNHILISARNESRQTRLHVYSLIDNALTELGTWRELRELSVSPGGRYVMFYLAWQDDPATNGVYLIDLAADRTPRRLDTFGAWRWRDSSSLYWIPFDPTTQHHTLQWVDVQSGESVTLAAPPNVAFTIADGHWEVSADGTRILYQSATDSALYVLEPR